MSRFAALTLVALTLFSSLLATVVNVEAKGPPHKVTISGGNLPSDVTIDRPDLVQIDQVGYFDSNGTPYSGISQLASEVSYHVDVYTIEPNSTGLQRFLSGSYFPATTSHPALISDDGGLWKAQTVFASLLDSRIKSAISPANLPSAGGPPGTTSNLWAYALAAGVTLLLVSVPALAYARRR